MRGCTLLTLVALLGSACMFDDAGREADRFELPGSHPPSDEIQDPASDPEDEICVSESFEATLRTLDLVFLVDRSQSMRSDTGNTTRWNATVDALTTFVSTQQHVGAGISFYPSDDTILPAANCDASLYHTPDVHVAPVGAGATHTATLIDTLQTVEAWGTSTPTYGALDGTLSYAGGLQDALPAHEVVVVLATDGYPTSCPGDQNEAAIIADMVAAHHDASAVKTFVIAIEGAKVGDLDLIAAAGGTEQAYDVTADIDQFSEAVSQIREVALGCEIPIPEAPAGETLNPALVNVSYFQGGTSEISLTMAMSPAACGDHMSWHYDDIEDPKTIALCPATCAEIKADAAARVEVEVGCEAIIQ